MQLSLTQLLMRNLKSRSTLDQMLAKVERWNGTTLGQQLRGLKSQDIAWAPGLVEDLELAVDTRNYLAHHFFIDYFLMLPSQHAQDQALESLQMFAKHWTI